MARSAIYDQQQMQCRANLAKAKWREIANHMQIKADWGSTYTYFYKAVI
jgi:hypothetical protein